MSRPATGIGRYASVHAAAADGEVERILVEELGLHLDQRRPHQVRREGDLCRSRSATGAGSRASRPTCAARARPRPPGRAPARPRQGGPARRTGSVPLDPKYGSYVRASTSCRRTWSRRKSAPRRPSSGRPAGRRSARRGRAPACPGAARRSTATVAPGAMSASTITPVPRTTTGLRERLGRGVVDRPHHAVVPRAAAGPSTRGAVTGASARTARSVPYPTASCADPGGIALHHVEPLHAGVAEPFATVGRREQGTAGNADVVGAAGGREDPEVDLGLGGVGARARPARRRSG